MKDEVLKVNDLSVSYHNNKILNQLSFSLIRGDVHAIVGQNAAGKTTLINAIAGLVPIQQGSIIFDGMDITNLSNAKRRLSGIYVVNQNLSLMPNLSVLENIFFERMDLLFNKKQFELEYEKLAKHFNLKLNKDALVSTLGAGEKKIVQIMQGYINMPKLLILDEPTACFFGDEKEMLFTLIKELKDLGITVLLITHNKLDIYNTADHVFVLFDGTLTLSETPSNLSEDKLLELMAGKDHKNRYPKISTNKGSPLLSVRNLNTNFIKDFNLVLYEREIVAITGVVGSYKTHLAKTLMGMTKITSGSIYVNKKSTFVRTQRDAFKASLGFISEEWTNNICSNLNSAENISLTALEKVLTNGFIDYTKVDNTAEDYFEKLVIRQNVRIKPNLMSGGEKQKLSLARMFNADMDILIIDEPTQGVDIPTKVDIYNIFNGFIARKKAILMITSDFSEACGIADRIIILKDGRSVSEFQYDNISEKVAFSQFM